VLEKSNTWPERVLDTLNSCWRALLESLSNNTQANVIELNPWLLEWKQFNSYQARSKTPSRGEGADSAGFVNNGRRYTRYYLCAPTALKFDASWDIVMRGAHLPAGLFAAQGTRWSALIPVPPSLATSPLIPCHFRSQTTTRTTWPPPGGGVRSDLLAQKGSTAALEGKSLIFGAQR
jgi:hypothetical protein